VPRALANLTRGLAHSPPALIAKSTKAVRRGHRGARDVGPAKAGPYVPKIRAVRTIRTIRTVRTVRTIEIAPNTLEIGAQLGRGLTPDVAIFLERLQNDPLDRHWQIEPKLAKRNG